MHSVSTQPSVVRSVCVCVTRPRSSCLCLSVPVFLCLRVSARARGNVRKHYSACACENARQAVMCIRVCARVCTGGHASVAPRECKRACPDVHVSAMAVIPSTCHLCAILSHVASPSCCIPVRRAPFSKPVRGCALASVQAPTALTETELTDAREQRTAFRSKLQRWSSHCGVSVYTPQAPEMHMVWSRAQKKVSEKHVLAVSLCAKSAMS